MAVFYVLYLHECPLSKKAKGNEGWLLLFCFRIWYSTFFVFKFCV